MKKKLLLTDTAPLYPPLWGGPKRIWGLYSNLNQDLFEITYVGVKVGQNGLLRYSYRKIRDNFSEILCLPSRHHYLWVIANRLFFKNKTVDFFLYLGMHTDRQFKNTLRRQEADVIICSHPWSSLCLAKRKKQIFIYDAHNCEYLLMGQILGSHPLRKIIMANVKRIEADACSKSDLILACSDKDKEDFISLYQINPSKIIVIPNGANERPQPNSDKKDFCRSKLGINCEAKVVVFVGAYYKPNIDAAGYIIEKLSKELNEHIFIIAGNVCAFYKDRIVPKNVILKGRIAQEELDIVLGASDIAVNPMTHGSGVNIKMLDFMSYGLPIVTTECGSRGINVFGKRPMIVAALGKFADNINALLEDRHFYSRVSRDGREMISEHYSWKKISDSLQEAILKEISVKVNNVP